jgi:hypothetical protein
MRDDTSFFLLNLDFKFKLKFKLAIILTFLRRIPAHLSRYVNKTRTCQYAHEYFRFDAEKLN